MKQVKIGQRYKYVPCNSIIDSLQQLVPLLNQCGEWRNLHSSEHYGYMTDVYDGKSWHEWGRKSTVSFLDTPGNILFMFNIEWFQPFEHKQYSVGVTYPELIMLSRAMRLSQRIELLFQQYLARKNLTTIILTPT